MSALAVVEHQPIGSAEAEAMLVCACFQSNKLIDRCAELVAAEDFSDPFFAFVYGLILREHGKGLNVSPVSLRPYLDQAGFNILADIGGSASAGSAAVGALDFARQIAELARRRKLVEAMTETIQTARNFDVPVASLASEIEAVLAEATRTNNGLHEPTAAQAIGEALDESDRPHEKAVWSDIPELNKTLGPIRHKDLCILAGRPGMCKTATALSYTLGAARKGHGALFISLEMGSAQLGQRLAADLCFDDDEGVPFDAITSGSLTLEQRRRIDRAQTEAGELPFQIVDVGRITIGRLDSLVRRWKRRFAARGQGLELVVIDYLQLVDPDRQGQNLTADVTAVSRGLKGLAKTHDVGVLALAQLSRKVEERHDKRPRLSDLRESGQIEQDADQVLFLFRPEYYLDQEEPPANDPKRTQWVEARNAVAGQLEFICAKRRQGRTGIGRGMFYGAYQAVRG